MAFLDSRPDAYVPRRSSDARTLAGAGALGASVVAGLALVWAALAPAQPLRWTPQMGPGDLAAQGDAAVPRAAGAFAEFSQLYAGVEGPDDERFAGSDTQLLTVAEGDTLSTLLQNAGATQDDAQAAIAAMSRVYDPRQIREGWRLTVTLGVPEAQRLIRAAAVPGLGGDEPRDRRVRLMSLSFKPAPEREIVVSRDPSGIYAAEARVARLQARLYRASGVIEQSLYLSTAASGVPGSVTDQLASMFAYDVDFQRDIRNGDSFEVFFTSYFDEAGRLAKAGDVLYASLTLQGAERALWRFQRGSAFEPEYFDAQGRTARRSLLKTPIEAARVSSGFGMRRHPILGYSKMHRGIDFAAPTGTPVKASGDGVVVMAGRNGGYGNYVRIRHTDSFETAYAHLNGFAKGLSDGDAVRQGQIIGYVGSTGLSTGPHLHYEILVDGERIDPAQVKLDVSKPLSGLDLAEYEKQRRAIETLMRATPLNAPVETAAADALLADLRGTRQ